VSAPAKPEQLVALHEEFSAGRDRRVVVARFATRWFVLEGFTSAPLWTYAVHGPCADRGGVSTHGDALTRALEMHRAAGDAARLRVVTA
jgi:hypothetical protein